jgi:hypothetical protein
LIVFFEKKTLGMSLNFTSIWAIAAFALNIPWFITQIRAFKPLDSVPEASVRTPPAENG